MKLKKTLCLLLSAALVLSIGLPCALAAGTADDEPVADTYGASFPAACEECGETEGHAETCSQYAAPAAACEECGETEGHAETCSRYVAPVMVDESACTCGEDAPENLAQHADFCPRKQYILTLIQNDEGSYRTARQIYADWDSYDAATRTDILSMVAAYVETEYDTLRELIGESGGDGFPTCVTYDGGTTRAGVHTTILAPEGTFSAGATLTVTDTNVSADTLSDLISDKILATVAVNIDFGGEQPADSVSVYMDIPDRRVPESANAYAVVHMGENGPELVSSNYLDTTGKGQTVSFSAEHFSSYVVVLVNKKYQSTLMRNTLKSDDRYTIKTLKANLFDYDSAVIDEVLFKAGTADGTEKKGFVFPVMSGDADIEKGINVGGNSAKQGILENTLQNGLPVIKYLNGNGGVETGKILFDPDTEANGKTTYQNVDFEFIYDTTNGYYTYNSALNHAQLNKTEKRVELYADALSMANEQYASPMLNQYTATQSMKDITKSATYFKATLSGADPWIQYTVNNYAAAEISDITIRAKITRNDGQSFYDGFALYFKRTDGDWGENKKVNINYTSNGEWMDFVFDMGTCAEWKNTIAEIRFDPVGNASSSTYTFEIDWIQINKKNATSDHRNGGYYPFSDIADSVPGPAGQFNLSAWKKNLANDETRHASRAIFNTVDTDQTLKEKHLTFGTVFEQKFYIPVSGKTEFGDDIIFTFNGDDDLWLFIDGELVLDIGGGHTPVSGTINLTQKTSVVDRAVQVTAYDKPESGSNGQAVNGTIKAELCAPGIHTMSIFYMERHSGVSNCFMRFNLPPIPESPVVVSKKVQDESNKDIEALKDQAFTFTITATALGNNQNNLTDDDLSYILLNAEGSYIGNGKVSGGKFTLKANQKAEFYIPENYKVTVAEEQPSGEDINGYGFVSADLTGSEGFITASLSGTIAQTAKGSSYSLTYVNRYSLLYGTIEIVKTGISDLDQDGDAEKQSSIFHIEGTSTTGEELKMDVVIVGNGSKTIVHVPVGTYTVTELTGWTWRYGEQAEQNANVTGGNTATVEFENKRERPYWLSGDNCCRNLWSDGGTVTRSSKRRKAE